MVVRARVRVPALAEGVEHARARRALQPAAALPDPERKLEVLGTPEAPVRIVCAELEEVLAAGRKEAPGVGRRRDRIGLGLAQALKGLLVVDAVLDQRPQEAQRAAYTARLMSAWAKKGKSR